MFYPTDTPFSVHALFIRRQDGGKSDQRLDPMVFPGMSACLDNHARVADLAFYFHYRAWRRDHGHFCSALQVPAEFRQDPACICLAGCVLPHFYHSVRSDPILCGRDFQRGLRPVRGRPECSDW